jgi:hypothetical protein
MLLLLLPPQLLPVEYPWELKAVVEVVIPGTALPHTPLSPPLGRAGRGAFGTRMLKTTAPLLPSSPPPLPLPLPPPLPPALRALLSALTLSPILLTTEER